MLKILIVRSKEDGYHLASYTTEAHAKIFPNFCEQVITTEDIEALITTLQNYISSEASHAIISLQQK